MSRRIFADQRSKRRPGGECFTGGRAPRHDLRPKPSSTAKLVPAWSDPSTTLRPGNRFSPGGQDCEPRFPLRRSHSEARHLLCRANGCGQSLSLEDALPITLTPAPVKPFRNIFPNFRTSWFAWLAPLVVVEPLCAARFMPRETRPLRISADTSLGMSCRFPAQSRPDQNV